ncbi:MAG: RecX family transcriptional regulator [Rhodospirillales bacterium]|nr:RecX family transcriptional regulator [Rhodospirillales bacterium]
MKEESAASPAVTARRPRGPKKATPEYLERAALYYLERYAAPAAHLRRLLLAKVARSARFHGTDPEAGAAAVEALIARLTDAGLLDDAAYAAARVRSLHRRGASARGIRGRLAAKGVAPELIAAALAALDDESGEPELAAALAFARRRRLGPYRSAEARAERREKDLAALARQGFDLQTARRVIDAEDSGELETEAGDR